MNKCAAIEFDYEMAAIYPYEVVAGLFSSINCFSDADSIAKAIKKLLGDTVICVDGSWMKKDYATIMDMLLHDDFTTNENNGRKLLMKAFYYNGFKYAGECSYNLLQHLYYIADSRPKRRMKCNYRRMRLENLSFVKELNQYFRFQTPDRYQDGQILHVRFQNDERNNHERVANIAIFLLKIYISFFFFSFD